MSKGASKLDKCAHSVFMFANDQRDNGWHDTGAYCARCGCELDTSYCEERLYMVRCRSCKTVTLAEACHPTAAAGKIGGSALQKTEVRPDEPIQKKMKLIDAVALEEKLKRYYGVDAEHPTALGLSADAIAALSAIDEAKEVKLNASTAE